MEAIENIINTASDFVWGLPLIILLVGTGLYLTFRLTFFSFQQLPYALKLVFTKGDKISQGDITHFQALMTALAATVGTGNIAGVASAVAVGGPGAVLWMWVTAFVGMATKYGEAILGVKYRIQNERGEMSGGPMYYIEKGLGMKWLAVIFAAFAAVAAFGIGNMVQSHEAAGVANQNFGIPVWVTGLVLSVLVGLVIIGGIRSIGKVVGIVVPVMIVFYVGAGLLIVLMNITEVPAAFGLIFTDAFTGQAMAGGAVGAVIQQGVARGIFSNEAGLGTGGIAAAAAKTDVPARQALVSMTQVFIDTIIVCTITGLALVMSEMYAREAEFDSSAQLTSAAFDQYLPGFGGLVVAVALLFFVFSTIVGWSYFGEKCFTYLFGGKVSMPYRFAFVIMLFVGSVVSLDIVWGFADVMNGLMAFPNLVALLLLSGVIVNETKKFKQKRREEKQA
ncbi:alanine/glycine:cation symporter family protein [Salisediminibacterium halotolerans]|uniref:Alanine or glycine:cation symporter, AGCS family n=1 Tax=Salisediminibacterium halotolerans TaxID=517425 RepID=A0A1H9WGK7_9BACI|nr:MULTISPECIES: sodium:alanine symporter family protein [Salisediminibacterium]RLJ74398.1 AGCS family alanine or glycine:cation symporter [Actinophytocola xinjiangensis]RPE87509.1 AGCS family alanine or glycine:cation symporter [Salisediminibacterium halotolerans]TWG35235.1 AGCS family alanine or glycine:cation symporter [Salisediminibacterium halotolerans]SES33038.1 alanine or glycine:cation symporter, AGCS family [Salisediminibacterium haloalkalitolerans]GEL08963.1 transporter [Salisedimini